MLNPSRLPYHWPRNSALYGRHEARKAQVLSQSLNRTIARCCTYSEVSSSGILRLYDGFHTGFLHSPQRYRSRRQTSTPLCEFVFSPLTGVHFAGRAPRAVVPGETPTVACDAARLCVKAKAPEPGLTSRRTMHALSSVISNATRNSQVSPRMRCTRYARFLIIQVAMPCRLSFTILPFCLDGTFCLGSASPFRILHPHA